MHPDMLLLAERLVTVMERMSQDVKDISTYVYDLNYSLSYFLKDKKEKDEGENLPACPTAAGQEAPVESQYSGECRQADLKHEETSVGGDENEDSDVLSLVPTGHADFVGKEEAIDTEEVFYAEIKEEPVFPLLSHSLCDESVDSETMDGDWQGMGNHESAMKGDLDDAEALTEPSSIQVEPKFDETSEETFMEENFKTTETTEGMDCGAMKRNRQSAEALLVASSQPIKAESDFRKISEVNLVEKNYEAGETTEVSVNQDNVLIMEEANEWEETWQAKQKHETTYSLPVKTKRDRSEESHEDDVNVKDSTKSMTSCPQAKTHQRMRTPAFNSHAVDCFSEKTNTADEELSKQCLSHWGKSHEENFRKSLPSSFIETGMRGEYRKQDANQLETSRRKCRGAALKRFRTQMNGKSSEEQMQSSSTEGSSLKQSKTQNKTRRPFCCNICGKCFHRTSLLEDHERIHTGEKPFQCALCEKSCTSKSNLMQHLKKHSEERPFRCSSCDKAFKRGMELKIHMRIHSGEKPFVCCVCQKAFAQRGTLITHLRSHTGEKPFRCAECGKAFSDGSSLNTHKWIHTGERPFACSDCGSRFTTRGSRSRHRAYTHGAAASVPPGIA